MTPMPIRSRVEGSGTATMKFDPSPVESNDFPPNAELTETSPCEFPSGTKVVQDSPGASVPMVSVPMPLMVTLIF